VSTASSPRRRDLYRPTGTRGFSYQLRGDGAKRFFGYVPALGRRVPLQSPKFREAKAEWQALCDKANKGERVLVPSKATFREITEQWWNETNEKLRPRYADEKEIRRRLDVEILPEWGHRRIGTIDVEDIFKLDAKLEARGLSESSRANYLKPARRVFDYAVFKRAISVSPFAQAPRDSLPSCNTQREHHEWTTEEIERFIRVAHERDERPTAQRAHGDQIEFMVRTGTRIAEASGVRFSDIDAEGMVLNVRRQFDKYGKVVERVKTKASRRRIPITEELLAKLNFRQSFLGLADDDFIFAEKAGGNPESHSNFRRRGWNAVVEATGLKLEEGVKVTPHDSRHALVSQLDELELDEDDAAALLGHTSGRITKAIYTHSFDRDKREARIREKMRAAQNGNERR
jgi:integrase